MFSFLLLQMFSFLYRKLQPFLKRPDYFALSKVGSHSSGNPMVPYFNTLAVQTNMQKKHVVWSKISLFLELFNLGLLCLPFSQEFLDKME